MEFLRSIFDEELNSEGEVLIFESTFERSKILSELEPETYELAFKEWCEERKKILLEKADDILKLYDNADRFEKLKKAYDAQKVTPFVGAGASLPSGYPTWTKVLFDICNESHVDKKELQCLIDKGEYEEAAELLYNDLGGSLFNENLELKYSVEKEISGPIQHLPLLFPKSSIITTNFDKVLERIYSSNNNSFTEIKSGRTIREVLRIIASGERFLLKIHGECNQVSDRVLLKSEYDIAYSEEKIVKNFINRFLFSNALLFIGCSLSVDRTINAMIEVVKENGAESLPRHYAFLELRNNDDRVERKKFLSNANIFPIWYPESEHDESIEALFLKLAE